MFRNLYDSDVTVISPQGRIHQIEYAMEAVKQGSPTVGLKNKDNACLIALLRASSELSSYQKKIFMLDDSTGISIAGLTADGKLLQKFMTTECLGHLYQFSSTLSTERLAKTVVNKMQINTQRYGRRPYGVGLLMIGYEKNVGPKVLHICPSANYYTCKAMSIGSRSQSARTYLEKNIGEIETSSLDDLIKHAIKAIKSTMAEKTTLTSKNCQIAIVGKDTDIYYLDSEAINRYLEVVMLETPSEEDGQAMEES